MTTRRDFLGKARTYVSYLALGLAGLVSTFNPGCGNQRITSSRGGLEGAATKSVGDALKTANGSATMNYFGTRKDSELKYDLEQVDRNYKGEKAEQLKKEYEKVYALDKDEIKKRAREYDSNYEEIAKLLNSPAEKLFPWKTELSDIEKTIVYNMWRDVGKACLDMLNYLETFQPSRR